MCWAIGSNRSCVGHFTLDVMGSSPHPAKEVDTIISKWTNWGMFRWHHLALCILCWLIFIFLKYHLLPKSHLITPRLLQLDFELPAWVDLWWYYTGWLLSNWHKTRHCGRGNLRCGIASITVVYGQVHGGIFLVHEWYGWTQPTVGGDVLGQVVLGYTRKKPIPTWLLLQFLPPGAWSDFP